MTCWLLHAAVNAWCCAAEFYRHLHPAVARVARFKDNMVLASRNNKECQQLFRSMESIGLERKRQKDHYHFVLHPFSKFKYDHGHL